MNQKICEAVEQAAQRALASYGPHGVNVVPISMARVVQDEVWLFNFFMDKTLKNVFDTPEVALACWTGFVGVQIKASVTYHVSDNIHAEARAWVATQNPHRAVRGVLVLHPKECFDISAGDVAGCPIALD